jgi:hypothetical protein
MSAFVFWIAANPPARAADVDAPIAAEIQPDVSQSESARTPVAAEVPASTTSLAATPDPASTSSEVKDAATEETAVAAADAPAAADKPDAAKKSDDKAAGDKPSGERRRRPGAGRRFGRGFGGGRDGWNWNQGDRRGGDRMSRGGRGPRGFGRGEGRMRGRFDGERGGRRGFARFAHRGGHRSFGIGGRGFRGWGDRPNMARLWNSDEIFKRLDGDDDGSISRKEFESASQRFRQRAERRAESNRSAGRTRPREGRDRQAGSPRNFESLQREIESLKTAVGELSQSLEKLDVR